MPCDESLGCAQTRVPRCVHAWCAYAACCTLFCVAAAPSGFVLLSGHALCVECGLVAEEPAPQAPRPTLLRGDAASLAPREAACRSRQTTSRFRACRRRLRSARCLQAQAAGAGLARVQGLRAGAAVAGRRAHTVQSRTSLFSGKTTLAQAAYVHSWRASAEMGDVRGVSAFVHDL